MPVGPYTGAQISIGNGVTTVFPYGWKILDQTHIEVKVDGVVKVLGADYAVSGVGASAGGNVTFVVAPANLAAVQRARKVPYKRDNDYQANGDFKEETVDNDFDLEEMQLQQLAADIARAFKAPLSVTADQILTDAMWAARASMFIGFDGAGNLGIFASPTPGALVVSAFVQTLLDDADANTFVQTLVATLVAEAAPAIDDVVLIGDTSEGKGNKMRLDDLLKVVNLLTQDLGPDADADFVGSYDASAAAAKKLLLRDLPLQRMAVSGCTYAMGDGAGGGDLVNDITIFPGSCRDVTDVANLRATVNITKQLDAAWAVGSAAGGLDTGAIGNNDYYIHRIKRADTGVVDALFSLSATAPNMPPNYGLSRCIGWFRRVGGTIVSFHAYETEGGGIEMIWDVPTLDVDLNNTLSQAKRTDAVNVPRNFTTVALLNAEIFDAAVNAVAWVFNPDHTGGTDPATAAAPLGNLRALTTLQGMASLEVRTSSAGLIAARGDVTTIDNYRVSTRGFRWARRN